MINKNPIIAIVVPSYKVSKHIEAVLRGIPQFVSLIIVVDDCSPDNTTDIVKNINDDRIHLISHQENQGVGGATLTGYRLATELNADIVVKMDGDDQMDPNYLPQLLRPILQGEADYTKGNRFIHLKEISSMPLVRRIGNAGLSFMVKIASGYWNIFDPTNGYTAINTKIINDILDANIAKRYFFEINVLLELGISRAVVQDVYIPARYHNNESQLSEIDTLFKFPPKLLKGSLRRILLIYYVRDFNLISILLPMGMILILFGSTWGIYHWTRSIELNIEATTGTIMLSVLPLILGVQFILQALLADIQNVPTVIQSKKFLNLLDGKKIL
jgi:dolichol-phosphate mannosyltransferase